MELILPFLAAAAAGVLSGWGLGGGTLLLLYLTAFAHLPPETARSVNLLFFLPCSAAALLAHIRQKQVELRCVLRAAPAGILCALLASRLAAGLDTALLKKLFGGFLLAMGLLELLRRQPKQ